MRAEPMSMTGTCAPGGTPAAGHAEMPAISLRGVSRRFGTLLAVDGVDLDVRRGEVFGLIGHNGAGKSTLFKMMLGLLPASGGSIRVAGADVSGRDARAVRRQVGYLPENVVLWDNLTGLETLRFFARVKAVSVDTCPAHQLACMSSDGTGGLFRIDRTACGHDAGDLVAVLDEAGDFAILDDINTELVGRTGIGPYHRVVARGSRAALHQAANDRKPRRCTGVETGNEFFQLFGIHQFAVDAVEPHLVAASDIDIELR